MPRTSRITLVLGAMAIAPVAPAAVANGAEVEKTTVTLGQTAATPDPSCPDQPCQAVGSVTGFQVSNGQTQSPFLAQTDGTIKSWTLTLAQPTGSQRTFFNGFFGTPPAGRPRAPPPRPGPTTPA